MGVDSGKRDGRICLFEVVVKTRRCCLGSAGRRCLMLSATSSRVAFEDTGKDSVDGPSPAMLLTNMLIFSILTHVAISCTKIGGTTAIDSVEARDNQRRGIELRRTWSRRYSRFGDQCSLPVVLKECAQYGSVCPQGELSGLPLSLFIIAKVDL